MIYLNLLYICYDIINIFLTVANIFITTFFPKFNLSFVMLAIFTIFFIIFSDVLIQPTVTNNNLIFIVIDYLCPTKYFMAFLPLCTIFKFYHINAEKSLSTDFSPHF